MTEQEKVKLHSGEIHCQEGHSESRRYLARFVRAGAVRRAGNRPADLEIEAEALRQAVEAGLFENRAVFVDHASWLEYPSLQRLVGVTRQARWNAAEAAVEGTLQLYDTPSARLAAAILDELLAQPELAPDIGLSIVFWPLYAPQEDTEALRRVRAIQHVESVDLVFEPAADGRVLQALSRHVLSSLYNRKEPSMSTANQPLSEERLPHAESIEEEATLWQKAYREQMSQNLINASDLPEASKERLAKLSFNTPEELQKAIQDEKDYIARLTASTPINIGGTPPRQPEITGMLTSMDRIQIAAEALFAGTTPERGVRPLTGIRELYHLLSGDYEMSGVFQPERVQLANVTSSTMAGLVANALNKAIVNEFQQYPRWWEPIVRVQDFSSLQTVRWITLGGIGELPTVSEGAAYTELTWDDQSETASFVKKGGYLGITLEVIDMDDTARVQAAPRALAQAAWLTLSKSIASIFTSSSGVGPTMSDGKALFHADHANLGTSALSMTSWNAARLAMRKQTELNSSERLGALTAPRYLLVPPDLEITALQILASEYDYTYSLSSGVAAPVNVNAEGADIQARMSFARSRVVVVDLWTDTNDWAAIADPRLFPTIGLGFRYGRTPEVYSVASPTAGLMFTNDTMPVKVRFFYAVGPMDWRGMYKSNVA